MKNLISGLHHVTAIASDPQRNLDFYVGILGLRLVKRTVNFDDPGTYHFYFGDAIGSPGTILTFFPWPHARNHRSGSGEVAATAFAIHPSSVGFWRDRLQAQGVEAEQAPHRFGVEVVRFRDPDGMALELIATPSEGGYESWKSSPIPAQHSLQGFHSVTTAVEGYERTARLLTETFGYRLISEEANRFRFATQNASGPGQTLDLLCTPDSQHASGGAGSVHHIAFRAVDDADQLTWREQIAELGFSVTPVLDRNYFHSIYFREPGGILFEIATDPPGFTVDEEVEELGLNLKLPSHYESSRSRIEEVLPPIHLPSS